MNDFNKDRGKVFSMEKHKEERHKDRCRLLEGTGENDVNESVHQLLDHMRRIRQAVPVNQKLQTELKQLLLNSRIPGDTLSVSEFSPLGPRPIRNFFSRFWLFIFGIVIAAAILILWLNATETYLRPVGNPVPVMSFWYAGGETDFTVSPEGAVIVARNGKLLLSNQSSSPYRVLELPPNWDYKCPAFSSDGKEVALVRRQNGYAPQIVVIKAKELLNPDSAAEAHQFEILRKGKNAHEYSDLTWSPGGSRLAYSETEGNLARVYIASSNGINDFISSGGHPAWSPDGSRIIVQRHQTGGNNFLYLVDVKTGITKVLGQGEQATWGENGFLAFVLTSQEERVLTYLPDGSPQFTVRQRIGEVRSIYAGPDGGELLQDDKPEGNLITPSTLLVSKDQTVTGTEIEWLKKLEMEGVREPRVLSLGEADRYIDPVFGYQGKKLFYSSQETGMASVLRIHLEERLWDRGEKQL
ncbi:MAG: hypothetical protein FH756_11560 [Firmicutes bacterium]|nr:hypothetical protein [Bacillota bacterium]